MAEMKDFFGEGKYSLEEMTDEEREDKLQQAKRGGGKEKPLRKLAAIGKKSDEEELKEAIFNEEAVLEDVMIAIDFHLDGEIDYNEMSKRVEDLILGKIKPDFKVMNEEADEPTDAEIKKADSVASAANKLQKLVKKMKDKAKDFKAAEGKAKEKIKDELKAMTAEKKKLEKAL